MTKPTEQPKPRTRSPEHAAASLCKELAALEAAEAKAKVAAKERAEKRERLLSEAGEDVLKMAQAMRGAVSK